MLPNKTFIKNLRSLQVKSTCFTFIQNLNFNNVNINNYPILTVTITKIFFFEIISCFFLFTITLFRNEFLKNHIKINIEKLHFMFGNILKITYVFLLVYKQDALKNLQLKTCGFKFQFL